MKIYLFLSVFICSFFNSAAQKSTLVFNQHKELSTANKNILDHVYHNMNDFNNHYFDLISKIEQETLHHTKLLKLAKARIEKVANYYTSNLQIKEEDLVLIYGSQYPILSLYKPKSRLTASGKIVLEENNRQCFDFNTTDNNPIITASNNKFYFPSNTFETLDGKEISNKTISICLWEFTDKKSLVYSGLTTEANGRMLETAGSYYIEAKFKGQELRLKKGESYTVEMASENSFSDMFTYYGDTKQGLIDWEVNKTEPATYVDESNAYELDDDVVIKIEQQQYDEYGDVLEGFSDTLYESLQSVSFYEMSAGKLGWINCDRFYEVKNTTDLIVRVNSEQPLVVRMVFRGINSVMPAYANSNHSDQYEASGIPKGEKVLLLAYSVKDENAIFGYKEITIGENKVENITLNNLSKARFKGAVSELLSFNN